MAFERQTANPPPLPARPPAMPGMAPVSRLLTPEELERFKDLLVFAQVTVEGCFAGRHKSPHRGSSSEFADYKEYVAGDHLNHLDWRVYGRTRRLYVRQYEDETDMVAHLLVDTSASMGYAGGRRQSKYILAARIAAALAYLMNNQGDKSALALFSDKVTQYQPPGGTRRHLHSLVQMLEQVKPSSTTGIAGALQQCQSLFKKRGRLVLLSDLLMPMEELFDALGPFVHRRFEILLLQVIDPDEMNLPALSVARFQDMETQDTIEVEPEEIRAAYQATMRERVAAIASEANRRRIQHALVDTRNPYLTAVEAYLGFRGRQTLSAG